MADSIRVGAHSCVIDPKDKDAGPQVGSRYKRMFPGLSPCEADEAATIGLGRADSRMDASLETRRMPAGFAVLGQLVAHDITADRSFLAHHAAAGEIRNFGAPRLLDDQEAEARSNGEHLGPVGYRIVAEVLLGRLDADPDSYRSADSGWRPTLPSAEQDRFKMADLLLFATEPPA